MGYYKWGVNDTLSSITILPYADTLLILAIKDQIGCISTDSVRVLVKALPSIPPNTDYRICTGDSVEFDAGNSNKGMKYTWYRNGSYYANSQKIIAKDSGEYIVQMIDSFTCDAYDTVNLFVNDPVIIGPLQDVSICVYDTITLQASGAQSYEWREKISNSIVSTTDMLTVNPTITTTYIIKGVVTYNGVTCTGYDTVTVNVKEHPVITFPIFPKKCVDGLALNLLCTTKYNGTVVSPTNLIWTCPALPSAIINGSQFDPHAAAPAGGTFVVYAYAEYNGCSATDSTTVQINPLPVVSAGNDKVFCENVGSVLLDTMAKPFNVKFGIWSILSPSTPASALTTINNPPGYSYFFNTSVAGVGNHELIYKYKDLVTNCENTDTVLFQIIPIPVANAGTLVDICTDHGLVNLNVASGCSPLVGGTWSGPGVNLGFFDPTINNTGTIQTYTLKYSVQAIGCSDEDSTTIKVYPIPNVSLAAIGTVCLNLGDIILNGTPNSGGTGTYTGNGVSGNIFNTKVAGVGTHKIKYHFKETASPFCEKADSILIIVQDEPIISIDPIQTLCEDDIKQNGVQVTCKINSPFGVQWSADNATGFTNATATSTIYHPSATEIANHKISFSVVSTQNGVCAAVQAKLDVNIYPTPSVQFTGDTLKGCKPLTVTFTSVTDAGNGATYEWDFGDPKTGANNTSNLANPVHVYSDSGIYSVYLKITTSHGCFNSITNSNYIEVFPYPVASFFATPNATTVALPKIKFTNTSTGNEPLSFTWDYGDGNSEITQDRNTQHTYSANDTGWYQVQLHVVSKEGCTDDVKHGVYIGPDVTVFIPNVFSPDFSGPDKNEVFKIIAGGISGFDLKIYDRWGETLYTSTNYATHGWDGNYLSQPCQNDVYIYKLLVTGYDGRKLEYDGTITLLR